MIGNLFVLLYLLYCFKYTFLKLKQFFSFDIDENDAVAKVKRKYPCKSL